MKKVIAILALGVAASAARGGDMTVMSVVFYTSGPDHYSDGSPVLEGEDYVLIWQANGTEFEGFREDGSLVNELTSKRLNKNAWRATADSNMPEKSKSISLELMQSGSLALYVLDSRRFTGHTYAADGSLVSVTTNLVSGSVQGFAKVAGLAYVPGGSSLPDVIGTTDGKTYLLSLLDDTRIESPVITGMRFDGDYVVLTVTATHPKVIYDAVGGDSVSTASLAGAQTRAVSPVSGASDSSKTIEIRLPRDKFATSQFFKVVRRQM